MTNAPLDNETKNQMSMEIADRLGELGWRVPSVIESADSREAIYSVELSQIFLSDSGGRS